MSKRFVYNTPVTEWYPNTTKPARVGVYERNMPWIGPQRFAYWNGRHWAVSARTPDAAVAKALLNSRSGYQFGRSDVVWRGLVRAA